MLQRFAIAWEQVAIEKDIYFQDKFNETLIFNMLVKYLQKSLWHNFIIVISVIEQNLDVV